MHSGWDRSATPTSQDADEAMREWRWRCYTDHLRDMGYDLDGGQPPPEDWQNVRPAQRGAARSASSDAG